MRSLVSWGLLGSKETEHSQILVLTHLSHTTHTHTHTHTHSHTHTRVHSCIRAFFVHTYTPLKTSDVLVASITYVCELTRFCRDSGICDGESNDASGFCLSVTIGVKYHYQFVATAIKRWRNSKGCTKPDRLCSILNLHIIGAVGIQIDRRGKLQFYPVLFLDPNPPEAIDVTRIV